MQPSRHPVRLTLFLAGLVLLVAGLAVAWKPPAKEYHGTIYYADYHGVWKVQLPGLEKTRLASQDLVDPFHMELSPDEQWLAYTDTRDHFQTDQPPVLWVLSTQAGTPVRVAEDVWIGTFWLANNQLLYRVRAEQGTFLFDPSTGQRQPAERWSRAFARCWTWLHATGREDLLQSCPPDDALRGYLRIVDLAGSHPITITEPYDWADHVQWSPDGDRVLFRDGMGSFEKLYVWNRQEGAQRQVIGEVSHQGYEFGSLTWSSDGEWATFTSHDDWYAVELSTGRVIPFGPIVPLGMAYKMVWSPDSRAILTPLTPPGQSEALWTGTPMAFEFRLSIVGIP